MNSRGWKGLLHRWRPREPSDRLWRTALARTPYLDRLAPADGRRLRELTSAFLITKTFEGVAGIDATPSMRTLIALRACVPILHLGLDWYDGWNGIVLYPADFRVHEEYEDETGVVHRGQTDLCGQSIAQGPMVLSWEAIENPPAPDQDLVIHECAHKLDTLNGSADGFPPLHADMDVASWTHDFTTAFEALNRTCDAGTEPRLDPYAAEHPAEFFAVASETFFTQPALLHTDFPAVYRQLCRFYRQDPMATS